MKEFRKRLWFEVALCASFLNLIHSNVAYSIDLHEDLIALEPVNMGVAESKDTYTMNFNSISIIEFIRFASKITNLNFVFEEGDLQFTVTVVSEEPVSAKNVMSSLAQILRVHDLTLLEQENNVIITKSTTVNQIPTIISADLPDSKAGNAVLVTRVFRIKNASLSSVANIIRPLTSKGALIEISNETRQLIVTDITTNVEKIASLLTSLDAPHTPLEIESYIVKNISPHELITLTQQIIAPFAEGNPLTFVSQEDTNTIFVISTPYLIERAMTVMEDLDIPPKEVVIGQKAGPGKNVFIYKAMNRSAEDLIVDLMQVASELKSTGGTKSALEHAIEDVQAVKDSNALMFISDETTITKLKEILISLDTATPSAKTSLFIYKIQRATEEQIDESLQQTAKLLEQAPYPDQDLIDTIHSMRWIKETNSLAFTGRDSAINYLKTLLPTFDVNPSNSKIGLDQARSNFLIYTPKSRSAEEIESDVKSLTLNLEDAKLSDPAMTQALESMQRNSSNNTLVFTGNPQSLERINSILIALDTPAHQNRSSQVFIYKPQYASHSQLQSALERLVPTLDPNSVSDQNLSKAINSMEWDPNAQSFIVTADPSTIDRLKEMLSSLDNPQELNGKTARGFFLYKLQHAQGDFVLAELKAVGAKIPSNNIQNQNMREAIDKTEWVKSSNSLLITGSSESIEQIKLLITQFDTGTSNSPKSSFFIYKPLNRSTEQMQVAISDTAQDLEESGLIDPDLFAALSSMRYVGTTNSLIFTGSSTTLDKVKELVTRLDTTELSAIQHLGKATFMIYKLQSVPANQLMSSLKNFAAQIPKNAPEDAQLVKTIDSMRYIKETNSILFTGPEETLEKIEALLKKFDFPSMETHVVPERAAQTFFIYNPKYLSGDELISILCDFEQNLVNSGVSDPGLFDTINNLRWIEKTSSLLISGDSASITKVQELLGKFDLPTKENAVPSIDSIDNTSFLVYKLQYHQGNEIQTALKQVALNLGKTSGGNLQALKEAIDSLQWIQVTNSLLSTGQQDILVKLKGLIENLDIPLRQVFIEVLVIETQLTNIQDFGLMWGGQAQFLNKATMGTGNFPIPPSTGSAASTPVGTFSPNLASINSTTTPAGGMVPFTSGFDLGVIGDIIMNKGRSFISLGSLVNALQEDNTATIIMNPKIIAQDNKQSTIFIGQNIPFNGAIVTNTTVSTVQTANIEYRDVGVSLTITPILGDNDIITLEITHDISELTNNQNTTISNQQLSGLQTSHTHMDTTVSVPDQHFVVLSGMINDSKTLYRTAIPCLGGLPVIGALFSENDRQNSKANVIIFIRPQIIKSYTEYKEITEHQEWLHKDSARLPALKEQFDEGIDMVKTPENE